MVRSFCRCGRASSVWRSVWLTGWTKLRRPHSRSDHERQDRPSVHPTNLPQATTRPRHVASGRNPKRPHVRFACAGQVARECGHLSTPKFRSAWPLRAFSGLEARPKAEFTCFTISDKRTPFRRITSSNSAQVFEKAAGPAAEWRLRYPNVERYIFVDDVCGSGETAVRYSGWLQDLRNLKKDVSLHYLALFATADGLKRVRDESIFGNSCGAIFELDGSYKTMSDASRYLRVVPSEIDPDAVRQLAMTYGSLLLPNNPLGYEDSQLLLGFHHNTPDNTLPIIWMDQDNGSPMSWRPAFRRYPKL